MAIYNDLDDFLDFTMPMLIVGAVIGTITLIIAAIALGISALLSDKLTLTASEWSCTREHVELGVIVMPPNSGVGVPVNRTVCDQYTRK